MVMGGPSMTVLNRWLTPEGSPQRLFIVGAGLSRAAQPSMPLVVDLVSKVLSAASVEALPTSDLESALAYWAQDHPFDRAHEPYERR